MNEQLYLKLEGLITNEVVGLGFQFVKLEFDYKNKPNILRIYVNTINGITLNECGKINYHLNKVLSILDDLREYDYILEVSSPGIECKVIKS